MKNAIIITWKKMVNFLFSKQLNVCYNIKEGKKGCFGVFMKKEERDYCKYYAISIEKFLSDNFCYQITNNAKRKWKIKHREIMTLDNVLPVPLGFSFRYKELLSMGKLVIVMDDYGFFKCYINPRIIMESYYLEELENELEALLKSDSLNNQKAIIILKQKIADLQENIRIINHFKGTKTLENVYNILEKGKGIQLKRVEKIS